MLVVVPGRSWATAARQHDVGVGVDRLARGARSPPPRSGRLRAPWPASARSGKSLERVGAEQHQRLHRRRRSAWLAGHGGQDAGGRRGPAAAGTEPQAAVNQARPASRPTRPGRSPGARPMSRAPSTLPRRRAGRNRASGRRGGQDARPPRPPRSPVLGQRRPADHDDHALAVGAVGQQAGARSRARRSSTAGPRGGRRGGRAAGVARQRPGQRRGVAGAERSDAAA